jgi:protein-tyrosine phosphatase
MRIASPAERDGRFTVCFVCTGNICRSPIAEYLFEERLREAGLSDEIAVLSAGTTRNHAGQKADRRTLDILATNGIDAADHRARQFRPTWFADVDLVVALDRSNAATLRKIALRPDDRERIHTLLSFDPLQDALLDVSDPYFSGASAFVQTHAIIDQATAHLVEYVAGLPRGGRG